MKIDKPNYTQLPNAILDSIDSFGDAELRVVLAVCRKTFGWHKSRDRISLSQLEGMTGMTRQGVINGINAAIGRGILTRYALGFSFEYELVVNGVDQASQPSRPVASQPGRHTKETVKET